jgi:hypothetical protein
MSTWPELDRRSLLIGALADVALTVPAGLLGNALGEDSNGTIILTLIVLIAPFVAGLLAARGHRTTSLTHGGVAAAIGWAMVIAVSVVAKLAVGNGVAVVASMTLGVWSVSLGLIGGYVTFRREVNEAAR